MSSESSATQGVGSAEGSAGWLGDAAGEVAEDEGEAAAPVDAVVPGVPVVPVDGADADVPAPGVDSDAPAEGVASGPVAGAEADVGLPGVSSAKADGADNSASGAIAAVAAAAAMARRSFMKTSCGPAYREDAVRR
ncbi:hypothetical protein ABZ858_22360 [Streptomyces sp. NPDC047017]|uniref:hypothetical protein n=1 Tax=Streptomyces sp. NPDC047017 TaxID=3155024 RepID=UPI0034079D70